MTDDTLQQIDDPAADHDHDFDGETVWVSGRRTGETNDKDRIFHTDPEKCRHFQKNSKTFRWTREGAEEWGYRECATCSGNIDENYGDHALNQKLKKMGETVGTNADPSDSVEEIRDQYEQEYGEEA